MRRPGRVKRDLWLSQYRKGRTVICGRLDTMSILNEIEHCYVEGLFISTIILSVCFIERVIASSLISNKHVSEDNKIQLGSAINMAKENNLFSHNILDRLKILSMFRNSLVHRKPLDAPNSFCACFLNKNNHPTWILEKNAKEAIDLNYAFFHAITEQ